MRISIFLIVSVSMSMSQLGCKRSSRKTSNSLKAESSAPSETKIVLESTIHFVTNSDQVAHRPITVTSTAEGYYLTVIGYGESGSNLVLNFKASKVRDQDGTISVVPGEFEAFINSGASRANLSVSNGQFTLIFSEFKACYISSDQDVELSTGIFSRQRNEFDYVLFVSRSAAQITIVSKGLIPLKESITLTRTISDGDDKLSSGKHFTGRLLEGKLVEAKYEGEALTMGAPIDDGKNVSQQAGSDGEIDLFGSSPSAKKTASESGVIDLFGGPRH